MVYEDQLVASGFESDTEVACTPSPSSPHSRCQPPCMSVLPTQPIHPSIQPTHAAHPSHPSSPAQSSPCVMRAIVPCAPSCHSYHVAPSFAPSLIVLVSPGLLQTCLNIHGLRSPSSPPVELVLVLADDILVHARTAHAAAGSDGGRHGRSRSRLRVPSSAAAAMRTATCPMT